MIEVISEILFKCFKTFKYIAQVTRAVSIALNENLRFISRESIPLYF